MPFVSDAQRRWAHTAAGRAALGDALPEWDAASKGLKLPARVAPTKKPPMRRSGMRKPKAVALPSTSINASPLARLLGLK